MDANTPRVGVAASQALARAIRRKLDGPSTGILPYDLAGAIVEVLIEFLGADATTSLAEINELFGFCLDEPGGWIELDDVPSVIAELAGWLYGEVALTDVLGVVTGEWSVVASSPEGTATMVSDSGIGLYQFIVDDRVYYFTVGDRDVCETEWWFAYVVGDTHAQTHAIRDGEAAVGLPANSDES